MISFNVMSWPLTKPSLKSERYGAQCATVEAALQKFDEVMFECVTAVDVEAAAPPAGPSGA